MKRAAYLPHSGSLPRRVCEYFLGNRDETLTSTDICVKFEHASKDVKGQLRTAISAGFVEERQAGSPGIAAVWGAGPNIEQFGAMLSNAGARVNALDESQPAPRYERRAEVPPAPRSTDHFDCALHASGVLEIEAGPDRITLSAASTRKLLNYLDRIAEHQGPTA